MAVQIPSWTTRVLTIAGALVVASFLGVHVARATGWTQDEAGFRSHGYGLGGWTDSRFPGGATQDIGWAKHHPETMLTAGEEACAWLKTRPDAPDDGDPRKWGASPLVSIYLRTQPKVSELPLHKFSRTFLVYQAFNRLCPRAFDAKTSDVDPDGPDG